MSNYCVYRYMMGDEWIYVGKAGGTLDQRISAHAREERFQPFLQECKISYIEFNHKSDMDHAEAALIKIQKPKLNISCKNDDVFPFRLDTESVEWKEYVVKSSTLRSKEKMSLMELRKKYKHVMKSFMQDERNYMDCEKWYSDYSLLVIDKMLEEYSRKIIDAIFAGKDKGVNGKIIVTLQKADDRFVDTLDILPKLINTKWTIVDNGKDSFAVYVKKRYFSDVIKDIAGYTILSKLYYGNLDEETNEGLKSLGVTSVDAALEHRRRCTEIYNNALEIIEEAKKYGLEQEE